MRGMLLIKCCKGNKVCFMAKLHIKLNILGFVIFYLFMNQKIHARLATFISIPVSG